jgi:hypothetical protein
VSVLVVLIIKPDASTIIIVKTTPIPAPNHQPLLWAPNNWAPNHRPFLPSSDFEFAVEVMKNSLDYTGEIINNFNEQLKAKIK